MELTPSSTLVAEPLIAGVPVASHKQPAINLQKAEVHTQAILKRIKVAHWARKAKKANHLTRMYLSSLDAHYVAVLEAHKSLHKYRRPNKARLFTYATELNPWRTIDEKVFLLPKEKQFGHYRLTMNFGFENRARQYLVRPVLEARANVHPHQYAMRGVHSAVQRVAKLMSEGYVWAIETDIKNCFSSFDGEKVVDLPPFRRG